MAVQIAVSLVDGDVGLEGVVCKRVVPRTAQYVVVGVAADAGSYD